MNNINRLIFTVIFLTSCKFCKSENAKLTVELMNSGFHRNLEYVIVFPDYQSKHHTFLIKQLLPASVYVSIDQLNDLYRFDKLNYYIESDYIDIEKPTEKSEPFHIYLYGDTAFLQTISLPIHFRYHAPGNKSFTSVNIAYPQLYVELDEQISEIDPVWMRCKDLRHRCKYAQVDYDNYSRRQMTANIPIGNINQSTTVTYATIALSWTASLFIIYVLRNKHTSLKVKLKTK